MIDLDPDKRTLFTTVPHTGTNSTRMMLDRMGIKYWFDHCARIEKYGTLVEKVPMENNVITTYRDPALVLSSWANRQKFDKRRRDMCAEHYRIWGKLLPSARKVFTMDELTEHRNKFPRGDLSGAYLAIEEQNWKRYFEIIPRDLYEYAREVVELAGLHVTIHPELA